MLMTGFDGALKIQSGLMKDVRRLLETIDRDVRRIDKAGRDRSRILAYGAYLGTLGLALVLPMVAGAYLGRWLDGLLPHYSVRWTLSLLLLGVAVGIGNVYVLIKK